MPTTLDRKVTVSESSCISCSPGWYEVMYLDIPADYFHLTQHHSGVVPHIGWFAPVRKLLETVGGSEDVTVWDERSPTSTGPVCLGGSQEEQSSPGELTHLRLLPANRGELRVNISSLALIFTEILPGQSSSFVHKDSPHTPTPPSRSFKK